MKNEFIKKMGLLCLGGIVSLSVQAQQVPVYLDQSQPIEQRVEDALSRMTLREKIRVIHAQSKFSSAGVPRLGFPDFWTDDGPMGVRPDVLWDEWEQAGQTNDSCVAFPSLTALAASWNPSNAYLFGRSLGEEARYRGKDMILGPGVNINRNPLNGRNFEYMGEDPFLVSTMVVPYIKGLQSTGTSACVKHFCLNNDETYRSNVNAIVSDRALHEIYLPAFYAAVKKGHVWAVMGGYNLYKGQHNCHNEYLLNGILKRDWQFDGVVISDWGGAHDTDQAVYNGLDMEFGSWTNGLSFGASNAYDNYYLADPYLKGISEGKYTEKELDDKVRRVLRLFYRTTMNPERTHGFFCSDAHYAAARQIGAEGIVLLRNKGNLLPLDTVKIRKVLVVGENAIKMMTVGGGSSSLKVQREVVPLDGIRAAFPSAEVEYARGYVGDTLQEYNGVKMGRSLYDTRSQTELLKEAVEKARQADVVILVGGLNKADHQDAEGTDRQQYGLPYGQDRLIEALAKANKNFVYVNVSGTQVAMPWRDKVPAILQAWYLGSETGHAMADVITGKVNPSGKLPFTWYKELGDCGAIATGSYPGVWSEDHKIIDEDYKEGIYVGYRWTDRHQIKPLFPFGFGLSYTTFVLSNLRASSERMAKDGTLTFTVNVKNTGHRAGAEVVELYLHENSPKIDRPAKELKGFAKVSLMPGESKDVDITIDGQALQYWSEAQNGWTADSGTFRALVGDSSDNLKLQKEFFVE